MKHLTLVGFSSILLSSRFGKVAGLLLVFFVLPITRPANADSGTWLSNPVDNNWNNPSNWSSGTVPDTPIFETSSITDLDVTEGVGVFSIFFQPGADAFTITAVPGTTFEIFDGVINNSSVEQNFVAAADESGSGYFEFEQDATITGPVAFTEQARNTGDGLTPAVLFATGKAGTATFHNLGASVGGGVGGRTDFWYAASSAQQSTIINEGGTAPGAGGAATFFGLQTPTADRATLIANGGINGGDGGSFTFSNGSSGGTARVELFGNGYLDMSDPERPRLTIGSLEGDGIVYLGSKTLVVGSSSLSTTFSGLLQPGTPGGGDGTGALEKIGNGTLTLTGASVYTAGTTVSAGTLVVANISGSATGTGPVSVNAGTLGGSGIISGAVTVGTGSGNGAFLAPAHGGNKQLTLTIQGSLTFNSDSTYTYTFKARGNRSKIDKVIAKGVTINGGATINLSGTAQGQLTQGMVLTLIKNTAATPINGTFSNLADGSIVTINGNNLQASYEGGDGNDLTLTVVP
jgi:autotransporter-associated beta strand protein